MDTTINILGPEPGYDEGDPAEFLLTNSKYHDCFLTVGSPETDEVENIGVATLQLISHSSVFRRMFANSKLADPTGSNTHIKDVSPATFKLMLRHVYGGKLPKMTSEEAAQLAMCADKYNIQHLVRKAAKRLNPMSAVDVFPALICVVYINCPDLELQVTKIIQKETEQVVQHPYFLETDVNCILFLVKQSILNIPELELWHNLVRWAENQVNKCPEKSLRDFLNKTLPYIRLLTLSLEEIAEHVLRTNILTPDEFVDLTLAVTNKRTIQSTSLCKFQEKRMLYSDCEKQVTRSNEMFTAYSKRFPLAFLKHSGVSAYSTLTIKPVTTVEICHFTFGNVKCHPDNTSSFYAFDITCEIQIYKSEGGILEHRRSIKIEDEAVPNENIKLPIVGNNSGPLVLESGATYNLKIKLTPPLPVYKLHHQFEDITTFEFEASPHMKIKFEDSFHILVFEYRVEETN